MGKLQLLLAMFALGMLSACNGGSRNDPGNTNPSQPPATDSVSGTVMFKGAPLAGVTITLWLTNTNTIVQTATTDASGNYTFSGLQAWGNVLPCISFGRAKPALGFTLEWGAAGSVIQSTAPATTWAAVQPISPLPAGDSMDGHFRRQSGGAIFAAYDCSAPLIQSGRHGTNAELGGRR